MVGTVEVDAPGGDLAGDAHERDRAAAGEVGGLQARRRAAGDRRPPRGRRAARWASIARPERADDPRLDLGRPSRGLDELFADRPGERLERHRAPRDPQPGRTARRGPDQRVVAVQVVEGPQVVVDAEGEAHARDRELVRVEALARPGPEEHAPLRGLRDAHERRGARRRAAGAQGRPRGSAAPRRPPLRGRQNVQRGTTSTRSSTGRACGRATRGRPYAASRGRSSRAYRATLGGSRRFVRPLRRRRAAGR